MKRFLSLLLACILLAGCSTGVGETPLEASDCPTSLPPSALWPHVETLSVSPKNSEAVSKALVGFGLELLQKTREEKQGAVLVSPLSVALALSMTANGAEGNTLAQFQDVLGGGAELEELNQACAQFMLDYQGLRGSSQCRIANSLWLDYSGGIFKDFVAKCRGYYSAQAYEAELSEDRIVDDINSWISDRTNKLIPKIIDEPFDESTACLLVNALYLKNKWAMEFDPLSTHEMTFHHGNGSDSQIDFLRHHSTELSYLQGKGAQGAVLPYDDGRLAFFVLMPDLYPDSPGLGDWLNTLEGDELSQLIDSREDAQFLQFAMPKFESEWRGNLNDALSALGLEDAFVPGTADFSKLGDGPDGYYISKVVHAARIEVNEKGTEAAAATVVAANGGGAPPSEGVTLVLDRPFLYGIVDLHTGVPLFLGTFE